MQMMGHGKDWNREDNAWRKCASVRIRRVRELGFSNSAFVV